MFSFVLTGSDIDAQRMTLAKPSSAQSSISRSYPLTARVAGSCYRDRMSYLPVTSSVT